MNPAYKYFGGKRLIAADLWRAFGAPTFYIEPFFGGGACLLAKPGAPAQLELINDLDCMIPNFWRAVKADAATVSIHADACVSEVDVMARSIYVHSMRGEIERRMVDDPEYFDPVIAGYWLFAMTFAIATVFHSGPHHRIDGRYQTVGDGTGISISRPNYSASVASAQRIHALQARFARVRVLCGDWLRAAESAETRAGESCAMLLDPPYGEGAGRTSGDLYINDDATLAARVREWAIDSGKSLRMRIALCGYEGEHPMPDGWRMIRWKAQGGFGNLSDQSGRDNAHREVVHLSPGCLDVSQLGLF